MGWHYVLFRCTLLGLTRFNDRPRLPRPDTQHESEIDKRITIESCRLLTASMALCHSYRCTLVCPLLVSRPALNQLRCCPILSPPILGSRVKTKSVHVLIWTSREIGPSSAIEAPSLNNGDRATAAVKSRFIL